jgi:hypothetical protein
VKYSVEKDILRYPSGVETSRAPVTIGAENFYYFDIGGGRYVWRTRNEMLEVGRIGGGWYGKVMFRLLEGVFETTHQAMRRCVTINTMYLSGEIAQPFPVVNPHRP